MNCIHTQHGLCSACQADYDADPEAWIEFGQHQEGILRWQELQDEMAAAHEKIYPPAVTDPDIPF